MCSRTGLPSTAGFPTRRCHRKYAVPRAARGDTPERGVTRRCRTRRAADQPARRPQRAEAALALGVRADRAQEVDPAEVGPVGLAEVELAVRALPQQEAAEPLLARGADHQVGVGLALGVEVLGDVLDVDDLGELLESRCPARRAPGSSERTASAISRRPPYPTAMLTSIPSTSRVVVGRLLELAARSRRAAGRGRRPGGAASAAGPASSATASSMIPSSGASSLGGRLRLSVESSHRVTTSTPSSSHHSSSGSMLAAPPGGRAPESPPDGLGPAAVAVEHHADVLGEPVRGERSHASGARTPGRAPAVDRLLPVSPRSEVPTGRRPTGCGLRLAYGNVSTARRLRRRTAGWTELRRRRCVETVAERQAEAARLAARRHASR